MADRLGERARDACATGVDEGHLRVYATHEETDGLTNAVRELRNVGPAEPARLQLEELR
jgi:hypothetical protein